MEINIFWEQNNLAVSPSFSRKHVASCIMCHFLFLSDACQYVKCAKVWSGIIHKRLLFYMLFYITTSEPIRNFTCLFNWSLDFPVLFLSYLFLLLVVFVLFPHCFPLYSCFFFSNCPNCNKSVSYWPLRWFVKMRQGMCLKKRLAT